MLCGIFDGLKMMKKCGTLSLPSTLNKSKKIGIGTEHNILDIKRQISHLVMMRDFVPMQTAT